MSILAPGKQWIGHNGNRAKARRLRQAWRQVEKLRDPCSIEVRERLLAVADGDVQDVLDISMIAFRTANQTGSTWAYVMDRMLDYMERNDAPDFDDLASTPLPMAEAPEWMREAAT